MKSSLPMVVLCLTAVFAASCMKVQPYHPVPLTPAATAASLQARTLSNPGLEKFIEQNLGRKLNPGPTKSWSLKMLTLAGIYYSPALQQARARVSAAKAAIVTAGEKPNPTFRLRPGIPSPYLYTMDLLFNIQTAGRRRIKVEQAKDLTVAARLNLAQATWKVTSNVRAALVGYFAATREVGLLRLKQRLQTRRVMLLQQRFQAGDISRPRVVNARLALLQTHVSIEAAEGRIPETRAAVAAAVGVPVAALKGIRFIWPDFSRPLSARSISYRVIQRDAVLDRLDVRKALAEYAAAQEALKLQIARQHSNILMGPGYDFNSDYFRLRYAVTLPIFNRNQGPIAQAEAQRKLAAANFLAAQTNAIARSEEALARYRDAWQQLKDTEKTLLQLEHMVIPKERRTVAAGEAGRLALNAVLLERPGMAQAWLTALGQAQSALGALEDAVERPLEPDEIVTDPGLAPHKHARQESGPAGIHKRKP